MFEPWLPSPLLFLCHNSTITTTTTKNSRRPRSSLLRRKKKGGICQRSVCEEHKSTSSHGPPSIPTKASRKDGNRKSRSQIPTPQIFDSVFKRVVLLDDDRCDSS
eukprot:scaffold115566_cov55-Cyclotella_meneghiniana.AAC.2